MRSGRSPRPFLKVYFYFYRGQGIKISIDNGLRGDVVLEAKTTELAEHYARDFGAVKLPIFSADASWFLIADDAAKNIFFSYLE